MTRVLQRRKVSKGNIELLSHNELFEMLCSDFPEIKERIQPCKGNPEEKGTGLLIVDMTCKESRRLTDKGYEVCIVKTVRTNPESQQAYW